MTLEQRFDQATLHIARETVVAHAAAAGMADDRAADVMLAVHELAANVVRHGGGSGRIRMHVTREELILQVIDPGPAGLNRHGHNDTPGRHLSGASDGAHPWPCQPGHGLWLVRQVADHVRAVSGPAGSRVTAVFALVPDDIREGPAGPGPAR